MNIFYLIRHGDKIREPGDPSLSQLGKEQARNTAAYLATHPISEIYTSPLARTKETAHIIAKQLGLIPKENELFIRKNELGITRSNI